MKAISKPHSNQIHSFKMASILCGLLILLLFIPTETIAMWAKLSDFELVESSDVILMGEIVGQKQIIIDQSEITVGVLKVDTVLKGNKNQAEVLLRLPTRGALQKSDDIYYKKGQKGLWFLRKQNIGGMNLYLADHPQRFLPQKDAKTILDRLKTIIDSNN